MAAALNAMRREVALYRHLATLVEDVPLGESLAELQWAGADRAAVEVHLGAPRRSRPRAVPLALMFASRCHPAVC